MVVSLINKYFTMTIDILFASMPYTQTEEPLMAPAYLKAIAVSNGFSARGIDLNYELQQFINCDDSLIDFFVNNNLHSESFDKIINLIDLAAERLLSFSPKIIGLSLLTLRSQVFTYWLCVRLKSRSPNTQIIIGGAGIKQTVAATNNKYCEDLKQQQLIDNYITGDAEISLVEFLKGNLTYPGINSLEWKELTDISNFPYADFDDYDFSIYAKPSIPITDSRGCVRTCEFCDYIEHWKGFVYRSAESVFLEMLAQIKRYNIPNFSMMNSLTNGNLKEFKKLMQLISDYNQTQPKNQQISWQGPFIIRPQGQHPVELWETMSKTNATLLLGVESVIRQVRWDLGKHFENEDIDYHLDMAKKYKVSIIFLMQIGYPRETLDDFEFTKQWFRDRVEKYGYGSPVISVNLATTAILENTKLDRNANILNLKKGKYDITWINQNSNVTLSDRAKYAEEMTKICKPFAAAPTIMTELKYDALKLFSKLAINHEK